MNDETADAATLMQVENVGSFVRALLRVELDGGHSVTYGVWIGVPPEQVRTAFETWWEPEYVELSISGLLANEIEPWSVLGSSVRIEVRDADSIPHVVSTDDEALTHVLGTRWPHDEVFATLPT